MTLSNAVKQRIINLANEQNIRIHKLALNAGVPYSTLSSFLNGQGASLTIATLLHICEGTGITLKEFFDDPLFDKVEADEKTTSRKD